MKALVIGLAGKIGSGKSTVASCLASTLNWPCISFGNYIRSISRQRGINESRDSLQKLGEALINEDAERFCRSVLSQAIWEERQQLIVEGIRHVQIADLLRKIISPTEFRLIYISLDEQLRELRIRGRGDIDSDRLQEQEKHSTEIDSNHLLTTIADLVVDGSKSSEQLSIEIIGNFKISPSCFL